MRLVHLGSVAEVIAGQSPEGIYYNSTGDGMPFYQGKKEFGNRFLGAPTTWTTKVTKSAEPGDILMSVRAPVGPINFSTQQICIGRGLAAIRPCEDLDRDFLFYFLLHKQSEISGNTGAVFDSINKDQIAAIEIPLPSLEKQRKVVEKLHSTFAENENAKVQLKKRLDFYSLLNEALIDERLSRDNGNFCVRTIKDVTSKIGSGATPRGGENSYKAEGIPLIRSLNVYDDGFRIRKLAHIDDTQAKALSNVEVQVGDVLLNITGASIARTCIAPQNYLPARVNQHVSIIRPLKEVILSEYLHLLLRSQNMKRKLLGVGNSAGSTRQALTKTDLENTIISFPPKIDEQREIVNELKIIDDLSSKLQNNLLKIESLYSELSNSLLASAFDETVA